MIIYFSFCVNTLFPPHSFPSFSFSFLTFLSSGRMQTVAEWQSRLDAIDARFAAISVENKANLDGLRKLPNYHPAILTNLRKSISRQRLRLKHSDVSDAQWKLLSDDYDTINSSIRLIEESINASIMRFQRLEEIRQRAIALEAAAVLDENAATFHPDPVGSIDLRAFAEDKQSVHRSSVQNSTHKAVLELLSRPAPPADQDTLSEITKIFNTSMAVRWSTPDARMAVVTELTDNYFNSTAFSLSYGHVMNYVWAYIRSHAEKDELTQRLAEELSEGRGMCSNGKMARLINVLQGYDDSLAAAAPRELFQQHMSELSSKPAAVRTAAAHALFAEFRIPESEHAAWLEPLLEA
jgi:hypothetical protein